jgi:hypothetical protein
VVSLTYGSLCTGHGLARTAELKLLGNGVVPQQAVAAITGLLEREG